MSVFLKSLPWRLAGVLIVLFIILACLLFQAIFADRLHWLITRPALVFLPVFLVSLFTLPVNKFPTLEKRLNIFPLVFLAMVGGIIHGIWPGLYTVKDYAQLLMDERVENISPAQASDFREAGFISFQDAVAARQFPGRYVSKSRQKDSNSYTYLYYNVCPLLPRGWTKDNPIQVWLFDDEAKPKFLKQGGSFQGLVVKAEDGAKRKARKQAEKKYGLSSHPEPVLIRLTPPFETELENRRSAAWLYTAIIAAVYGFIAFLIPGGRAD